MSNEKTQKRFHERGLESLVGHFQDNLSCEGNKPDFKELDLGSPVSPLRTNVSSRSSRAAAAATLTTSSCSSSSSGSATGKTAGNAGTLKRSDGGSGNHSGELSGSSEGSPTIAGSARSARSSKPGHQRSDSGGAPLIYSGGGGSVNSPNGNLLPSGNICPSGRIGKTGMAARSTARSDVLGSGTVNYGHGNIMRGKLGGDAAAATGNIQFTGESVMVRKAMASSDPEEVKRAGNEQYKRGNFAEALCLYDRAIAILPNNAACRSNRAAALMGLGRLAEAVRECEEAVRLDPSYGRAHQRLAALHLRLGQVEIARRHLFLGQQQPEADELQKLEAIERHLNRCTSARRIGDWKSAMRDGNAAITAGADSSPQLFACRAEALLKLHHLEEADSALSNIPKFDLSPPSSQTKFFGMLCDSYPFFVRAQVELALGRFENAVTAADKAGQIDPRNVEVAVMLNKVRSVAGARSHGNDLFNSGKFAEACIAYGEGLKLAPSNPVLYCNRAACRFKLEQWERSVDDCNEALKIQPNYTKALLRRAACNSKLERWAESVRDYEVLMRELPDDKEVVESLFHAQVAMKKSHGEEVHNMKFGGEVEEITGVDQFRAAVSSPGVSVIHFMVASDLQSVQMSTFFDVLCVRYPSLRFLKVDVDRTRAVAKAENVRFVPTFKIYKKGNLVKEMIRPSEHVLEYSVRNYSF